MENANFALMNYEFKTKTKYMNNYILYMESLNFLETLKFALRNKVKFFYCYEL